MSLQIGLFALVTVAFVIISRRTLLRPRSHGFFRFFAWEGIAALVVLNGPSWFVEPFTPRQVVSWFILCASVVVLALGVGRLRTARRANDRSDRALYDFEKTSQLVTSGIYAYIRHPLYASLLYLAWGAMLKEVTWWSIMLAGVSSVLLFAAAVADERECVEYFGNAYRQYMTHTARFIPWLF